MKTVLSLLLMLALASCKSATEKEEKRGTSRSAVESAHEVVAQVPSEPDEDLERKEPSETFMGFFENFMWNEEYQKSRIEIPLTFNGRVINSANEWEYKGFYATKAFIPILLTDSITYYEKDIAGADVKMSVASFENQHVENFIFSKQDNNWILKEVDSDSIGALSDFDFIRFLEKFSTDTSYQVEHVNFPIPNYYADPDKDYETVYDSISIEDWSHINVVEQIEGLMTLNRGTNSNIRDIFFRGVENGIYVYYRFLKVEGEWKLVKLEDYST